VTRPVDVVGAVLHDALVAWRNEHDVRALRRALLGVFRQLDDE
jgi:hypothetical protein